ncbi:hypothetical protein BCV64_03075 [Cylindrospermopsis raciborskii MVCC14]|nr:hypothetical protein BCV64_03075 [Cylindrospermopsis raciborskii MVCC14]
MLDVNPSFLRFSGYSELELIGYSFDNLPLIYNPEQGLLLKEQLKNQGYVRNLEFDWLIKSGEVKTSLLSCEPIVIDNKDCVISIIKDITDRKKTEENLRQSEERFRTAFENAGSGMALVSLNILFGRFRILVNDTKLSN